MSLRHNQPRRAYTMVEILMAVGVFSLVSLVVFQFISWSRRAQDATSWKQSATDAVKLNEVFWQQHFTAATFQLKSLNVNAMGIIQAPPEVIEAPVKIRSGGEGDIMASYSGGAGEWEVWTFKTFRRNPVTSEYDEYIVTGYLKGSHPAVELHGRVVLGGNVVNQAKLLENVTAITSSTRSSPDENINVLSIEFEVSHPRRSALKVSKKSNFRVSTTIESL